MELAFDINWTSPPSADQPAWILCRGVRQFPVPDDSILEQWAERGRIRPDDYLINCRLDTCVQAKDLPALKLETEGSLLGHLCRLFGK